MTAATNVPGQLLDRLCTAMDGPLGAIRRDLEVLAGGNLAGPQQAALQRLERRHVQLLRLWHSMQDLAEAEHVLDRSGRQVFDLAADLRRQAAVWRALGAKHGVRVALDADKPVPTRADPIGLRAGVRVVMEHVLHRTPEQGRVDVGVHRRGRNAWFTIEATAPPGRELKPESTHDWPGQELAQWVLESHGARWETERVGSTRRWWFSLPLARPPGGPAATRKSTVPEAEVWELPA